MRDLTVCYMYVTYTCVYESLRAHGLMKDSIYNMSRLDLNGIFSAFDTTNISNNTLYSAKSVLCTEMLPDTYIIDSLPEHK